MPMGAEITGLREHVADRRWRMPDADAGVGGDDGARCEADAGQGTPPRPTNAIPADAIRLNPVERANPAFAEDPAFGRTASGAYGGRGPRIDEGLGGASRTTAASSTSVGRWVRTGGCGFRWLADGADRGDRDDAGYWRWVTSTLEQAADADDDGGPSPATCGDFAYLENGDGTVTLVEYSGSDAVAALDIPDEVDGLPVSVLGASLFVNRAQIESVTLPGALKAIDDHAFDGCAGLAHVDFPSTLEHIGMLAFAKAGLKSVRVPSSVKTIGEKAFFHCKRLSSVEFVPGLLGIGEMAFAYSGVGRVCVPATVVDLGFNAFDLTPAQKHVAEGTIAIDPGNARYRFDGAGLYRDDAFIELIGYVSEYSVAPGTRRVGEGACKRHPSIRHIALPEGLVEIGEDAFRSNRNLVRVDLPESLAIIGPRAFVDTSVARLRISANVRQIGESALLVQGESQMKRHPCLSGIDLDVANERFYIENGLFCERDASPQGGDVCLLYIGPDNVVRIPDAVTMIAVMAFGSTDGVDELFVHDHIGSFCSGWLSTARTVPLVHVDFGFEVDGCAHGDFRLPSLTSRFRYPTSLFGSYEGKTVFDFDYYDSWVTCTTDIEEFAPAAYERLRRPVGMTEHTRGLYEGIFARKSARICRYFAEHGQIEALELLMEQGLISDADIDSELEVAMRDGRGHATACLLEMRHRNEPARVGGIDFSL